MPHRHARSLKVLVLAGGPDRERPVSLLSGQAVAEALQQAGHEVMQHDIRPGDLSALDAFEQWGGDVIFPALHGKWGEGGGLQHILDRRGLTYVGCSGMAAELCMDKHRTKLVLEAHGLPTPAFEVLAVGEPSRLEPPVVVKPVEEGSSLGMAICRTPEAVQRARHELRQHYRKLLVERYVVGKELTVGVVGRPAELGGGYQALPPIQIIPATAFYDYQAKYERDDTQYLFDIELPADVLAEVGRMALAAHQALSTRHLCRVDFLVDEQGQPWVIEVNTMPGFTSHSLLPMAARQAGLPLPALVDRLVRLAAEPGG